MTESVHWLDVSAENARKVVEVPEVVAVLMTKKVNESMRHKALSKVELTTAASGLLESMRNARASSQGRA